MTTDVIEMADPGTWPAELLRVVGRHATSGARPDDLYFVSDAEVDEALEGLPIRLYHGTRLTGKEATTIRSKGMLPLTRSLLEERVREVVADGLLTEDVGAFLLDGCTADEPVRRDVICWTTNRRALSGSGLFHPLHRWGGEALSDHVHSRSALMAVLRSIGTPTVVVANVRRAQFVYESTGVLAALVSHFVGEGHGVEVRSGAVSATSIGSLQQPGSDFWGRFVDPPPGDKVEID